MIFGSPLINLTHILSDAELLSFMRTLHFLIDVNRSQNDSLYSPIESDDENDYFEETFVATQEEETLNESGETDGLFPSHSVPTAVLSLSSQPQIGQTGESQQKDLYEFMSCVVNVRFFFKDFFSRLVCLYALKIYFEFVLFTF